MANGTIKHGSAVADRAREELQQLDRELERAIDAAEVREQMQSAHDLEEDSKLTAALLAKPAVVVMKDGHDSERPPHGVWQVLRWLLLLVAAAIGTALAAYLNAGQHH